MTEDEMTAHEMTEQPTKMKSKQHAKAQKGK